MTLTKAFLKPLYSRCLKIQLSSEFETGHMEDAPNSFFEMYSSSEELFEFVCDVVSLISSPNCCLIE